jgi:hypothetical protein
MQGRRGGGEAKVKTFSICTCEPVLCEGDVVGADAATKRTSQCTCSTHERLSSSRIGEDVVVVVNRETPESPARVGHAHAVHAEGAVVELPCCSPCPCGAQQPREGWRQGTNEQVQHGTLIDGHAKIVNVYTVSVKVCEDAIYGSL